MTDERIVWLRAAMDHVQRVAGAATLGPWHHNPDKQWLGPEQFERYDMGRGEEFVGYGGPSPFTGCVAATGPSGHAQSMADATFIALHDPRTVLARVEADRRILDEAMSWRHDYHDDDPYYSCAQAASTWEDDRSPGSGCTDDDRSGGPCDCGLDRRRALFVGALLSAYRHTPVPGFREEWITG